MAKPVSAEAGENPLVPNTVLRQLYATMRALRASSSRSSVPYLCPRGLEAVYASSLLSLGADDLISATTGQPKSLPLENAPLWIATRDTSAPTRLLLALGAASALRTQGGGKLLLSFVAANALPPAQWQQTLGLAGAQALPIIFVVTTSKRAGWVSSHAQAWGVPGIPVDSTDAVALYRVLQESVLRARHGDGPTLIEPIAFLVDGPPVDPLHSMRQLLRRRGLLSSGSTPRSTRRVTT